MPLYGEARRAYQREKRKIWRIKIVEILGGKCAVCGALENLEVHHKNQGEKEFNISQIWSHAWKKQAAELKKCELRCSEHHKESHASPHGTDQRYKLGCRCGHCVSFYRSYKREYMARRRAAGLDKSRKNYAGIAGRSSI